ncbi:lactoperoxidase-like [Strongylocentrotus purpuratus]|uniref:Peroxidase n=1 Tax=Strongylocentrotus purpuratus TaxID=7668 RepID=A0A7M7PBA8_STRPU|nr:lactoperoxidase-like [Strongylocentrotus purpuratus]
MRLKRITVVLLAVASGILTSCYGNHEHHERDSESMIHWYGTDIRHRDERSAESSGDLRSLCEELGYFIKPETCMVSTRMLYHTADGSCNNLLHPSLGKAGLPHKRYLPAEYGDGIGSLHQAEGGRTLPSTREITNIVVRNDSVLVPRLTAMTMHFGQLLDHDVGHTPVHPNTCGCETKDNCIPIAVPSDDPAFRTRCLPLSRSKTVPGPGCVDQPREQLNQITTFIDGSILYGSSASVQADLRGSGGLLRARKNPFDASLKTFLPDDEENAKCDSRDSEFPCGKAGDKRAAVQEGLTTLHTIFMRYHNEIAKQLSAMNPHWGNERVFLETRKIVSSVLQHISYNEYLPVTLGSDLMKRYRLSVGSGYPYRGYQANLDPTMPNVFAHAAFRMGHSQVSSNLTRVDVRYREVYDPVVLRLAFFNGSSLHDVQNGGIDSIVRGMLVQPLEKIDRFFSEDVTRFLFADPLNSFGLDLVAINTQRGRDHGLPGYTKWRSFCGLPDVSSFDELGDVMSPETIDVLKKAYTHVDDIDAFIGMVVEEPINGALVGQTVGCILGEQFHDLKFGDRFWYENPAGVQALKPNQRNSIRQMTFARLICETLDTVDTIQPFVFHSADKQPGGIESFADYSATHEYPDKKGAFPDFSNARVSCKDFNVIPPFDLRPWLDRRDTYKCGTTTNKLENKLGDD